MAPKRPRPASPDAPAASAGCPPREQHIAADSAPAAGLVGASRRCVVSLNQELLRRQPILATAGVVLKQPCAAPTALRSLPAATLRLCGKLGTPRRARRRSPDGPPEFSVRTKIPSNHCPLPPQCAENRDGRVCAHGRRANVRGLHVSAMFEPPSHPSRFPLGTSSTPLRSRTRRPSEGAASRWRGSSCGRRATGGLTTSRAKSRPPLPRRHPTSPATRSSRQRRASWRPRSPAALAWERAQPPPLPGQAGASWGPASRSDDASRRATTAEQTTTAMK